MFMLEGLTPDLPPAVQTLLIASLAAGTWYAFKRWVDRLDKMIEKIDDAIDGINKTLAKFGAVQENHGDRIKALESKGQRHR